MVRRPHYRRRTDVQDAAKAMSNIANSSIVDLATYIEHYDREMAAGGSSGRHVQIRARCRDRDSQTEPLFDEGNQHLSGALVTCV